MARLTASGTSCRRTCRGTWCCSTAARRRRGASCEVTASCRPRTRACCSAGRGRRFSTWATPKGDFAGNAPRSSTRCANSTPSVAKRPATRSSMLRSVAHELAYRMQTGRGGTDRRVEGAAGGNRDRTATVTSPAVLLLARRLVEPRRAVRDRHAPRVGSPRRRRRGRAEGVPRSRQADCRSGSRT